MVAVQVLSGGVDAVIFFLAFLAFVVAAVVSWPGKYTVLIATGLALVTFVSFWNALSVS